MIDDIGYVQQSGRRWRCCFTLLAERYERGSVLLTSNLPFFQVGSDLQGPHDNGVSHRPAVSITA